MEDNSLDFEIRLNNESLNREINSAKDQFNSIKPAVANVGQEVERAVAQSSGNTKQTLTALQQAFRDAYEGDPMNITELKASIQQQQAYLTQLQLKYKEVSERIKGMPMSPQKGALEKDLKSVRQEIDLESASLKGLQARYADMNQNTLENFRTKMMKIRNEMSALLLSGVSEQSAEYKALEEELGKLATLQRKINRGMLADSTGATQWSGIIEGVQGAMGAYTAFSGVLGLVCDDQEKLMQIQTKCQSLMSILMGMQQLSNTLHETSTFRLRTLTAVQDIYNSVLNKAKSAFVGASTGAKILRGALMGLGIGLVITAITALVSWLSKFRQRSKDSAEATKKMALANSDLASSYSKIYTSYFKLESLWSKAKTDKDKAKFVKEYAEELTTLDKRLNSVANVEKAFNSQSEAFQKAMLDRAKAVAMQESATKLYEEYYKELLKAQEEAEQASKNLKELSNQNIIVSPMGGVLSIRQTPEKEAEIDQEQRQEKIDKVQNDYAIRLKVLKDSILEATQLKQNADKTLNDMLGENKEKAEQKEKSSADSIESIRQKGLDNLNNLTIATLKEGHTKVLAQLEKERQDKIKAIEKEQTDLTKALKDNGKEITQKDNDNFDAQKAETNKLYDQKIEQEEEKHQKQLQKLYKDTTDYKLTEEERALQGIKDKYAEQVEELKRLKAGGDITDKDYSTLSNEMVKSQAKEVTDYWLQTYANYYQQREQLAKAWEERLAMIPTEFAEKAKQQMQEELSNLDFQQFQKEIDWSSVFGNLGEQATQSIVVNYDRLKSYFEQNKDSMGANDIKELQDAMVNMEQELNGRNPFASLVNSIKDIKIAKQDVVLALEEIANAQKEYNQALEEERLLRSEMEDWETMAEDNPNVRTTEDYVKAQNDLNNAIEKTNTKQKKLNTAQDKQLKAQNRLTKATKQLATAMQSIGGVISKLGSQASDMASIWNDDVAQSIGKAVDTLDALMDAVDSIIDASKAFAKTAISAVGDTVGAVGSGMEKTTETASKSMAKMEKASAILAIISAAMQVAMAIANLFNNDNQKQKEIEKLQRRIDQLQWEVDNANTARMQRRTGDILERVKNIYTQTRHEVDALYGVTKKTFGNWYYAQVTKNIRANQTLQRSIEKIVASYASMGYTADKALGLDKYNEVSEQMKNYAEQIVLVQQQMDLERSKKKTDKGKVADYEEKIKDLSQKLHDAMSDAFEDIIGSTADDIATDLGSAFMEACQKGEDAMESWHAKTNEIVADIIKRMMIQDYLQPRIAKLMDTYMSKVFNEKTGGFNGVDAVNEGALEFKEGLDLLFPGFKAMYDALDLQTQEILNADNERTGESKGIATASQDSIDELNGRMTAVQGHTYTISENSKLILSNTSVIMNSVLNIEQYTDSIDRVINRMEGNLKDVRNTMNEITLRGIKMRA